MDDDGWVWLDDEDNERIHTELDLEWGPCLITDCPTGMWWRVLQPFN